MRIAPIESPYFSLNLKLNKSSSYIQMRLYGTTVNTKNMPSTYMILKNSLPSILRSTCFNNANKPFSIEVKETEVGHLFEHMLLEFLCELKLAKGFRNASFKGKTCWDWYKDVRGVFHITTSCGVEDSDILLEAIQRSNKLLGSIMETDILYTPYKQANSLPVYMVNPADENYSSSSSSISP